MNAPDRPSLILADRQCSRMTLDETTTPSAHIMEHDISQLACRKPVQANEELGCYSNSIRKKPYPDTIAENTGEVKLMIGMPVSS